MGRTMATASVLLSLLACGPGEPEGSAAGESSPPNPVEGLITAIEGTTVELRAEDGRSYRFEIADPTVPVQHLRVHLRDELPVLITWRAEDDGLVATTIADAPA
jgi:hypothetical protein